MAGHSKWKQIKRAKAKNDAQRSATISKHLRAVQVAVRDGGPDPEVNLHLRNALLAAKADNVPGDNLQRAIERATGGPDNRAIESVTYEGYGPGGVALLVEALTDSRPRTVSEVRHALERHGGSLGAGGSVAWQFDRRGVILAANASDATQELAIELGAIDLHTTDDGNIEIQTDPVELHRTIEALKGHGVIVISGEISMIPQRAIAVPEARARQVLRLLEALEELDDVQNVYSNLDLADVPVTS